MGATRRHTYRKWRNQALGLGVLGGNDSMNELGWLRKNNSADSVLRENRHSLGNAAIAFSRVSPGQRMRRLFFCVACGVHNRPRMMVQCSEVGILRTDISSSVHAACGCAMSSGHGDANDDSMTTETTRPWKFHGNSQLNVLRSIFDPRGVVPAATDIFLA